MRNFKLFLATFLVFALVIGIEFLMIMMFSYTLKEQTQTVDDMILNRSSTQIEPDDGGQ